MNLNVYIRKEERRKEISLLELNFPLKKLEKKIRQIREKK